MIEDTRLMDHLFRQQSGKMASILTNLFGFEYSSLIDDIIQDTFFSALQHWKMKGLPENPEAWLMQVAKNKIINELNRKGRHNKLNQKYLEQNRFDLLDEEVNEASVKREQILALFTCCSPLLSPKSQIMLTLKIVSGFGDKEIAKALLMSEQAVRKAIYRSRNTLKDAQLEMRELGEDEYQARLETVLRVLYLMFNEGYLTSSGDEILDEDISFEAIRITEWLLERADINHGEVHALLGLMYFTFARFPARTARDGRLIDIQHQDRSLWDKGLIQRGIFHQKNSRETSVLTKYHIECGIASAHCLSDSYESTDWGFIAELYHHLQKYYSSDAVKINYAVVLSESGDSRKSIEILKKLEKSKKGHNHLLFGALARVYENMEDLELAKSYYKVALDLAKYEYEKNYLEGRIHDLLLKTNGNEN